MSNFVTFVTTYSRRDAIINIVKTPQYIIYILHPIISEIPSPKGAVKKLPLKKNRLDREV